MWLDNFTPRKSTDVFPDSWTARLRKYDEYLEYWTGEIWEKLAENIQVEAGRPPLRWPVKINLIKILSLMHAQALWGEWEDEVITFQAKPKKPKEIPHPGAQKQEEAVKNLAQETQEVINAVWAENNRETLLIEESLAAQVYGGCVFRLRKDLDKEHTIKIEYLSPYFFRAVWHPTDFHQLYEARVQFEIAGSQARSVYGMDFKDDERVKYVEVWTKGEHTITVGDESYVSEKNPYGVIPYVYIPRLRMEEFYGLSLCEDLMGLQDELNDRVADIGDQILQDCHALMILTNYMGDATKLRPTPDGILNLGLNAPGHNDPQLDRIPAGDIPKAAFDHINFILDTAKMAAFTPPVAFGQDEGSQRSGVTLIIRLWPLLQQCKWSRAWWDDGFKDINELILTMLKSHGFEGYKEEWEGHTIVPQWAAIQPKDREALVQELSLLAASEIQSLETMVERLGNTQDNEEEISKIRAWMRFKSRIEKPQEKEGGEEEEVGFRREDQAERT